MFGKNKTENILDALCTIESRIVMHLFEQVDALSKKIDDLQASINDLKQIEQENILPDKKDEAQAVIDNAFKLKNGLYSFKKVSIRDGE